MWVAATGLAYHCKSGSVFSMPGIVSSILFVGLSDEIAAPLAQDDSWGGYDSYRRFLESWAREAWGLGLHRFRLVDEQKSKYGARLNTELAWESNQQGGAPPGRGGPWHLPCVGGWTAIEPALGRGAPMLPSRLRAELQ